MALFVVSPEKEKQLISRMRALGIREKDLEEQFVRSSGAGGQKVNKTSPASCSTIALRAFALSVKRSAPRPSTVFSREESFWIKSRRSWQERSPPKKQRIEKIRRQKRRRSRRAKLRLLADKRRQAEKKTLRVSVRPYNQDD